MRGQTILVPYLGCIQVDVFGAHWQVLGEPSQETDSPLGMTFEEVDMVSCWPQPPSPLKSVDLFHPRDEFGRDPDGGPPAATSANCHGAVQ